MSLKCRTTRAQLEEGHIFNFLFPDEQVGLAESRDANIGMIEKLIEEYSECRAGD